MYVKCVWFKTNNDDGHSCIDITVVCKSNAYDSKRNNDTVIHELIFLWCVGIPTSNAHGLKRNDDNGHSCIDITVVCTSNAYDSK